MCNIELMAKSIRTYASLKLVEQFCFLYKAHHSLVALDTRQHFSAILGAILSSEITNKKHTMQKTLH